MFSWHRKVDSKSARMMSSGKLFQICIVSVKVYYSLASDRNKSFLRAVLFDLLNSCFTDAMYQFTYLRYLSVVTMDLAEHRVKICEEPLFTKPVAVWHQDRSMLTVGCWLSWLLPHSDTDSVLCVSEDCYSAKHTKH